MEAGCNWRADTSPREGARFGQSGRARKGARSEPDQGPHCCYSSHKANSPLPSRQRSDSGLGCRSNDPTELSHETGNHDRAGGRPRQAVAVRRTGPAQGPRAGFRPSVPRLAAGGAGPRGRGPLRAQLGSPRGAGEGLSLGSGRRTAPWPQDRMGRRAPSLGHRGRRAVRREVARVVGSGTDRQW